MRLRRCIISISVLFLTIFSGCNESNVNAEQTNIDDNLINSDVKNTIHLTNEDFLSQIFDYETNTEWVYKGTLPAIVDFYADWCEPCRIVAPILDELAEEYAGKIIIYKVDTEVEKELAAAFGIQSIPSLLFIPVNAVPQMAQGALPKETFERIIAEVLKVELN